MYGRIITFTLLAPSLWAVVNAVSSKLESADYKRYLFKAGDNNGFIFESFVNKSIAGSYLEVGGMSFSSHFSRSARARSCVILYLRLSCVRLPLASHR